MQCLADKLHSFLVLVFFLNKVLFNALSWYKNVAYSFKCQGHQPEAAIALISHIEEAYKK